LSLNRDDAAKEGLWFSVDVTLHYWLSGSWV